MNQALWNTQSQAWGDGMGIETIILKKDIILEN
jgi:hypothetical protein